MRLQHLRVLMSFHGSSAHVMQPTIPWSQPRVWIPSPKPGPFRGDSGKQPRLYRRSLKLRPIHFPLTEGLEVRFMETRPPSCGPWRNCSEISVPTALVGGQGGAVEMTESSVHLHWEKFQERLLSTPKKCPINLERIQRRFRDVIISREVKERPK